MNIKPYHLHFYNKTTNKIQQNIWNELQNGCWKTLNINNYLANSKIPANQPYNMLNIYEDFIIIPPGTYYDEKTYSLKEELYYPKYQQTNKQKLYEVFENYFAQFSNKKIAVHLSGGLDSSIIICLLHHFNIPFYLVGLVSNRFEFRTEKIIQEKLFSLGKESVLIDIDDYPFFSGLTQKAISQFPDGNIKQVGSTNTIIQTCKKIGADIVFTGQGGDTIFVDAITDSWSCNIGSEFILNFESEVLYPNGGLELVSPFADKQIIQAIYSLRMGQKEDALKKWTRNFFKDILPRELAEYTYYADFNGISMSGLEVSKPEIKTILESAYALTGNEIFSTSAIRKLLKIDLFNFEYQDYIEFCDKISIAAWYNALKRENYA